MKCKNCGEKINPGARFCVNCGAKVTETVKPEMQTGSAQITENANSETRTGGAEKKLPKILLGGLAVGGVAVAVVIGTFAVKGVDIMQYFRKGNETKVISGKSAIETFHEIGVELQKVQRDEMLACYQEKLDKEEIEKVAMLYLDEDAIPEMLYISDNNYEVWTYAEGKVKQVDLSGRNRAWANASWSDYEEKYNWDTDEYESVDTQGIEYFEYIPKKNFIRLHNGVKPGKGAACSYIDLNGEKPKEVLYTEEESHTDDSDEGEWFTWTTYSDGKKVEQEEFEKQRIALGFDKLQVCNQYYGDVKTAYENIDKEIEKEKEKEVYEQFLAGEIDAIVGLEEISKNGNIDYQTRSYSEYTSWCEEEEITKEYVDFDNDNQNELVLTLSGPSTIYFNVVGGELSEVFSADGTAESSYVLEMDGYQLLEYSDTMHMGRSFRNFKQYDACNCIVDDFSLSAEYWDSDDYDCDSSFSYRGESISVEEYVALTYKYNNKGEELSKKEKDALSVLAKYDRYNKDKEQEKMDEDDEYVEEFPDWYRLVYLDEDDIPELIVGHYSDGYSGVFSYDNILAYEDGKVISFKEEYPLYDIKSFVENKGVVFVDNSGIDYNSYSLYRYKKGTLKEENNVYRDDWDNTYYIKDKKVSKKEYTKALKSMEKKAKEGEGPEDVRNKISTQVWYLVNLPE